MADRPDNIGTIDTSLETRADWAAAAVPNLIAQINLIHLLRTNNNSALPELIVESVNGKIAREGSTDKGEACAEVPTENFKMRHANCSQTGIFAKGKKIECAYNEDQYKVNWNIEKKPDGLTFSQFEYGKTKSTPLQSAEYDSEKKEIHMVTKSGTHIWVDHNGIRYSETPK
jgi:hypothetical protein